MRLDTWIRRWESVLLVYYTLCCLFGDHQHCRHSITVYAATYEIAAIPLCKITDNEYLDISSLECIQCDDDSDGTKNNQYKVPNEDDYDLYGNALSCVCQAGYYKVTEACSTFSLQAGSCAGFTCSPCSSYSTASSKYASLTDGSACVPCGNSTSGLAKTGDCSCPIATSGFLNVLLEVDQGGSFLSAKECSQCKAGETVFQIDATQAGAEYSSDLYSCQSCPDPNMAFSASGACSCSTGYTITGVETIGPTMCVSSLYVNDIASWKEDSAVVVYYTALLSTYGGTNTGQADLSSLTFSHWFTYAGANCYSYSGPGSLSACQLLANLCVLQTYSPDTEVCDLFTSIVGNRGGTSYGTDGWAVTLPWLYYADSAESVRTATGVEMSVSFMTMLQIKLAKYSLNGTWLGLEDMHTEPYYCGMESPATAKGGGTSRSTKYLKFGYGWTDSFTCDLATLLQKEQYFYDPYLVDESTGYLYPIPVLITNYIDGNNNPVNFNTAEIDEADDQFTRRFMFYDVVSGLSEDTSSTSASGGTVPTIIKYASSIKLTVEIRKNNPDYIYPPTLQITYTDVRPGDWEKDSELQYPKIDFQVEYTMDTSEFWGVMRAFFAVGMVFTAIVAAWRLRNWHVRRSRADEMGPLQQPLQQGGGQMHMNNMQMNFNFNQSVYSSTDWPLFIQGAVLIMHTFTLTFTPFAFLVCGYWFAFFKLQDTVYLLLPSQNPDYATHSEYYPLQAMINMGFFFQFFRVSYLIFVQSRADIFFVDWEKSRGGGGGVSDAAARLRQQEKKKGGGGVSVWRTLMVANEWAELALQRKISLSFNLLWLAFLLVGQDLQYSATPQPDLGDTTAAKVNIGLRFANSTFWWLLLSGVQWLWVWVIFERYVTEPSTQKFVDLATMAKISVLVLDEKYHGWYLHCRSPYPHADVPLAEMTEQLDKEESGLTTDRGMEGCPTEMQVFELFVTATWRRKYDKIYGNFVSPRQGITEREAAAGRLAGMGRGLSSFGYPHNTGNTGVGFIGVPNPFAKRPVATPRMVQASEDLTAFLQGFVEQSYSRKELERSYREPAWLDRLLGNPPDMRQLMNSPCILYPDRWTGFSRTCYLGIEGDLLLLNILTFSVCDVWFGDTATSILLTYLLDRGLQAVRARYGQANVARKAMVDERFLC